MEDPLYRVAACTLALFLAALFAFVGYPFLLSHVESPVGARVSVSGMSISSLDLKPSSRQLNGTWHIDFSLLYKGLIGTTFRCDSAAVSVYYKGAYLAGVNLHAFRATREHPIPLEANVDASRSDMPGWLAHDLAEARTLGVVEFEVQFVAKCGTERITYLCGGLRLGFSTTEEAKLIGDAHVRCRLIG